MVSRDRPNFSATGPSHHPGDEEGKMLNRKFVAAAGLLGACLVSLGDTWPAASHLMATSETNEASRPFDKNPDKYLEYTFKFGNAGNCGCASQATLGACVACARAHPNSAGKSDDVVKGWCVKRMAACGAK